MKKQHILVVDDEATICDVVRFNLEIEGFEVTTAESAEAVLNLPLASFDLLVLDVMMGQMSGFDLALKLKSNPTTASLPIIFCTAKDAESDTVAGLTIGADDYITKPFSVRELVARVKAVLRRTSKSVVEEEPERKHRVLRCEGIEIDLEAKVCHVDGAVAPLTKKELELLTLLMSHRGQIFSREELLNKVWSNEVVVIDRTVDVFVTRLRKKIDPYGKLIVTRHGYGYGIE